MKATSSSKQTWVESKFQENSLPFEETSFVSGYINTAKSGRCQLLLKTWPLGMGK